MTPKINRRSFIKKSAAIGAGSVLGQSLIPDIIHSDEAIDIAVVKGLNYLVNAKKAVALLGGIKRFVPAGSRVALLANAQSNNPGTFTNPQIIRAAIQICKTAGASEIACLGWLPLRCWRNTGILDVIESEDIKLIITSQNDQSQFKKVAVPNGKALKEAHIIKKFYDYNILFDMNITKEHSGNNMSGALKNLMGLNSPFSCQSFHKRHWTLLTEDREHLGQCIADLNTIIEPHLCIIDATEFVITNGPMGPGKLRKPQKVIAGTDRVAIDAYCAALFGYNPFDIISIKRAYEHGLGEINLERVKIKEINI